MSTRKPRSTARTLSSSSSRVLPTPASPASRTAVDRPDRAAFPCLALAYRALEAERSLPVVLNAANEIAVARFLEGRLGFTGIPRVIEETMNAHRPAPVTTLAEVRNADRWARERAAEIAQKVELEV